MATEKLTCGRCNKVCSGKAGLKIHAKRCGLDTTAAIKVPSPAQLDEVAVKSTALSQAMPPTVVEPDRLGTLEQKFDQLLDVVTSLAQRPTSAPMTATEPEARTFLEHTSVTAQMVPKQWKEITQKVLGSGVELLVEDSADGNFLAYFYMPPGIDRRVGDKKGRDFSTGLIRRASPTADLEKWCNLILANIKKSYPDFQP
jgi:hypothetical protein